MKLARWMSVLGALALQACAFGQKFSYADVKLDSGPAGAGRTVAVAVLDQRPYVLDGSKEQRFVGLSRGGFGNPFAVATTSGEPLAKEMSDAVVKALVAKGVAARSVPVSPFPGPAGARQSLAATGAERQLLFTLAEWKSDSMARTGLDFDVSLDVMDRAGAVLGTARTKGKEVAEVGVLSAEPEVQRWFAERVAALLVEEAVAATLR